MSSEEPKDPAAEEDLAKPGSDSTSAGPGVVVEDGAGAVMVQDQLPDTMFVFPLRTAVPFPNLMMPLLLDSEAARDIVAKAEAHNGHLLLVLQRDPERPPRGLEDLHEVGVVTRILRTLKLPDGGMSAMTQGLRRAKVHKLVRQKPHMVVRIKEAVEIPAQGPRAESLFRLLQKQLRQLAEVQDQVDTGFATALLNVEDPGQLADFTGGIVRKVEDRQRLLDAVDRDELFIAALNLHGEQAGSHERGQGLDQ